MVVCSKTRIYKTPVSERNLFFCTRNVVIFCRPHKRWKQNRKETFLLSSHSTIKIESLSVTGCNDALAFDVGKASTQPLSCEILSWRLRLLVFMMVESIFFYETNRHNTRHSTVQRVCLTNLL